MGRPRSGSEYRAPGRTSVEDLAADHVVFSTCPRRQLIPCMHAPSQTPVNPLSLPLCLDSTSSSQCICTSNSVTPYSTSTVAFLTILGGKTINIRTTHEAVSRIPAERALIFSVATQESGCPTLLLSHSSCRWDVISPAALLACFNNVVCP